MQSYLQWPWFSEVMYLKLSFCRPYPNFPPVYSYLYPHIDCFHLFLFYFIFFIFVKTVLLFWFFTRFFLPSFILSPSYTTSLLYSCFMCMIWHITKSNKWKVSFIQACAKKLYTVYLFIFDCCLLPCTSNKWMTQKCTFCVISNQLQPSVNSVHSAKQY